jgi:hypothetical protein
MDERPTPYSGIPNEDGTPRKSPLEKLFEDSDVTRTILRDSDEPCQTGPDNSDQSQYFRYRDGSKKRENKTKNRAKAKAAAASKRRNRK